MLSGKEEKRKGWFRVHIMGDRMLKMVNIKTKIVCIGIVCIGIFTGIQDSFAQYNIPRGWMDGGGLSPIYPASIDEGYSKQVCIGTNTAINNMALTIIGSQTVTGKLSVGTTTTSSDSVLNVVGSITVSSGIVFGSDNSILTTSSNLLTTITSSLITSALGYTPPANTSGSITTALGYTPPANTSGSITTALGYTPISNTGGTITGSLNVTGTFTVDYLSYGGTSITHDGAWTETASGTHTITAPTIFLDSSNIIMDASGIMANYRKFPVYACDFMSTSGTAYDPFIGAAISSGQALSPTANIVTSSHPGVQRLVGSSSVGSGYYIRTGSIVYLFGGGERFESIYSIQAATATNRIGFHDTTTAAQPTDGAWLSYNGTMTVVGNTSDSSTYSTTTTSFTGTVNTWYRGVVEVGSSATLVTYSIYDDSETLLWTDTLNSNIPTATGRECGAGITSTSSDTAASNLIYLDYMSIGWTKALNR